MIIKVPLYVKYEDWIKLGKSVINGKNHTIQWNAAMKVFETLS